MGDVIFTRRFSLNAIEYMNATGGTTAEYTENGTRYRSHTFLGDGTFEVTELSTTDRTRNEVDVLIVGGGGHGGDGRRGGGGGAGGLIYEEGIEISTTFYPIVVGEGSEALITSGLPPADNSSAFGLVALGGGVPRGGGSNVGGDGGSAAGGRAATTGGAGGTGLQPTSTDGGFGNNGGNGRSSGVNTQRFGGGGGGAGGAGTTGSSSAGGTGGAGRSYTIRTGASATYAVGGTANNSSSNTPAGTGNGGNSPTGYQTAPFDDGADGIVVIRYEIAPN